MRRPKGCETIKNKAGLIQEPGALVCCPPLSLVRVDSVMLVWLVECDQSCVNNLFLYPKPEAPCILLEDTTCKYSHHTNF